MTNASNISSTDVLFLFFFFSSRRRHTRFDCDWSSDVCSSDLFSTVYAARDRLLERPVALKILSEGSRNDEAARVRLRREAVAAAAAGDCRFEIGRASCRERV